MKGIKLVFVGVCFGLLGIAMRPDVTPIAAGCALVGVIVAIVGYFVKDN